ncbi:MAG: DUF2341 domain-containing protein, partial [Chitinivibrionales bacterium]|nr:DUF2341 domain-containing protein [Chitinivibrionales bacterium]MBD3396531.1 DUF2341 domain-containing protein [Chitinivibrionales bacterium]
SLGSFITVRRSKRITLNTTVTGAGVSDDVYNFPVFVCLRPADFNFASAHDNGTDVRFRKPGGAALAFEIERWDSAAQRAEIWVLVDTVFGNDDEQYFEMYWGDDDADGGADGAAVFDTANGFVGVWHFSGSDIPDATGYANDGTNGGTSVGEGVMGTGRDFGAGEYIEIGYDPSLNVSSATLSAWIRIEQNVGDWQAGQMRVWDRCADESPAGVDAGPFGVAVDRDDYGASGFTNDQPGLRMTGTDQLAYPNYAFSNPGAISSTVGAWQHITVTAADDTARFYVNGVLDTAVAEIGTLNTNTRYARIGNTPNLNRGFEGDMDEVRFSGVARSAAWVKLLYESQRDQTPFYSIE